MVEVYGHKTFFSIWGPGVWQRQFCFRQTVPVMKAAGYYSRKQGGFIPLSQADGEEEDVLGRYWTAEYNSLFDPNHTDQIFFPLTE
jgi:hypothetical protein